MELWAVMFRDKGAELFETFWSTHELAESAMLVAASEFRTLQFWVESVPVDELPPYQKG